MHNWKHKLSYEVEPAINETSQSYDGVQGKLDAIYDQAMEAALDGHATLLHGKSFTQWVFDGCYQAYKLVCDMAPYLIVFSILFGILICACARRNKGLQKWAIVWLILLIPLGLIVFRFGIGIFIGIF